MSSKQIETNSSLGELDLNQILQFWKAIDLDGKRLHLDQQGLEIADHQESSVKARKVLAESTKSFRRQSEEEKVNQFGPLLKAYQEEVDRLTRRSRFAENAFLELYRSLYESPDPVPALQYAVDLASQLTTTKSQLESCQLHNQQLEKDNEELESELKLLKNQDITIRKLEEDLTGYEKDLQSKVEQAISGRMKDLEIEWEEKQKQLLEREEEMNRAMEVAQQDLIQSQRRVQTAEEDLLSVRSRLEEEANARQQEVEILHEDLNRARAQILSLQSEIGSSETVPSPHSSNRSHRIKLLESDLDNKTDQLRQLQTELRDSKREKEVQSMEFSKSLNNLQEELKKKQDEIFKLKQDLEQSPKPEAVQKLRRQLTILKAGYIGSEETEDSFDEIDLTSAEQLMVDQMKKFQDQNIKLRASINEATEQMEDLKQKICQKEDIIKQQQSLIEKLEEDISNKFSKSGQLDDVLESVEEGKQDTESLLRIITGQRDRFRNKISRLERDVEQLNRNIDSERRSRSAVERENSSLYEKIKYLQTYRDTASKNPNQLEEGEETMLSQTPNLFNRRDRTRNFHIPLQAADQITLKSGKMLLGNRYTRVFLFFYTILLHSLVFLTLYHFTHVSHGAIKACPVCECGPGQNRIPLLYVLPED